MQLLIIELFFNQMHSATVYGAHMLIIIAIQF